MHDRSNLFARVAGPAVGAIDRHDHTGHGHSGHGHADHAHAHHDHPKHGTTGHDHGHRPLRAPVVAPPGLSVLRLSLASRLAAAAVLSVLIWAGVFWAMS